MTQDDVQEQQPSEAAGAPADAALTDAAPAPEPSGEATAPASGDAADPASPDGDSAESEDGKGSDDAVLAPEGPIEVGSVTFVVVQRITPYGAFVALSDGRSGLIHISEIDRNYVKDVREHLREGDKVEAKVTAIKEDGKIDLSIKALQDPQPRMSRGSNPEFEQMLRKFMRGSEERQVDVKRSHMRKRK